MSFPLTLTSPAYDSSAQKFGADALSGGSGVTSAPVVTGFPVTIEAWAKRTASPSPSATEVVAGQAGVGWIGMTTGGDAAASYGSSPAANIASSVAINDGNWHHLALVVTASGGTLYVDGTQAGTSSTSAASTNPGYTYDFQVAIFGSGTTNSWHGETDEVAVFDTARYSANFSVPTAAYTGSETGLLALYHLDGNGNDSTVQANAMFAPNASGILYSPYNWLVSSAAAKTINGGAYFKTIFTGSSVSLSFTLGTAPYPEAYLFIDGQLVWSGTLTATVTANIPSAYAAWPQHALLFIVKSTSAVNDRWNAQVTAAVFTGLTLSGSGTLAAPVAAPRNLLFFGDSITEGCWSVGHPSSPSDDADYYDSTLGWAYLQGSYVGAEVGVVGFSLQGYLKAGQGNVPALPSSYNYLWSGQARTFSPAPDAVIVNLGTNDVSANGVNPASIGPAVVSSLQGILALVPSTTKLIVMRAFNGSNWSAIEAAAQSIGSPQIVFADTTGFFNTADSADGIHPLGVANISTIAPSVGGLLKGLLAPPAVATSGRSYSFF